MTKKAAESETRNISDIIDSELHDEVAPLIAQAVIHAGHSVNSPITSVIIAQSVLTAVLAHCVQPEGHDEVLKVIASQVGDNLSKYRLSVMEVAGTA